MIEIYLQIKPNKYPTGSFMNKACKKPAYFSVLLGDPIELRLEYFNIGSILIRYLADETSH